MSFPTPPPEQPMDADARARVRARLLEETRISPHPQRPWLVPVGAAVAVLAIAFGAGYAAFRPAEEVTPMPAPATTTPSPSESEEPTPAPSPSEDPEPEEPEGQIAREGCAKASAQALRPANVEQVRTWPLPAGEASIWVTEDGRSVLCAQNAEITTLHQVRRLPVTEADESTLSWSTDTYRVEGGGFVTAYVAGGPLPEGVTGIRYEFPGETVDAVIKDGWWVMAHAPTDGPLTERGLNFTKLPPLRVTVALSGMQYDYDLSWPEHMCAQTNHGC